jgi:hypothetical protein
VDDQVTSEDERALAELRASLLRRRCAELQPGEGEEAFDQHLLLAVALHRVSRLHKSHGENDTKGWVRYLTDFFPEGRNDPRDAHLLWDEWRCTLLKDERPVIPISHGQSEAYWLRDGAGRPFLNLEDLWADYEVSVDQFIEHLREHADRRKVALDRWRKRAWHVGMVTISPGARPAGRTDMAASVASSSTLLHPPPSS